MPSPAALPPAGSAYNSLASATGVPKRVLALAGIDPASTPEAALSAIQERVGPTAWAAALAAESDVKREIVLLDAFNAAARRSNGAPRRAIEQADDDAALDRAHAESADHSIASSRADVGGVDVDGIARRHGYDPARVRASAQALFGGQSKGKTSLSSVPLSRPIAHPSLPVQPSRAISAKAHDLARRIGKDPARVQASLDGLGLSL